MSEISTSFHQLDAKVKQLIERKIEIETLLKESERKRAELNSQFIAAQKEIEDLNEKNKILRIASGSQGGDNREIKLKINEIVREVDKCIAQLNQ
ncbi:MAG: hypothetical protein DWP98_01675 [Bacteroidetes bacterium]|nr:MAG: hypothetical protein DWP98_01675 [Bacteroidota bacterium]MBL1144923.1 hypothetical protein [Bacteroidota bacterium]MCB0803205.1 hypothetical protein [Flavobacteriales bacterium]NOG57717.1 hypothetical protein [Bacteroidota bacterium]